MLIDERASGHYERKGETVELYQRKITIAKRRIVTAKIVALSKQTINKVRFGIFITLKLEMTQSFSVIKL
jgi:hypothetical protein